MRAGKYMKKKNGFELRSQLAAAIEISYLLTDHTHTHWVPEHDINFHTSKFLVSSIPHHMCACMFWSYCF